MIPEDYFNLHRLSPAGLRAAGKGLVNKVYLTRKHVLRLSEQTDHALEAQLALHALSLGVHTAKPLYWGQGYGLWERLPGKHPENLERFNWEPLLQDLEKLHTCPPQITRPASLEWAYDPSAIAITQGAAQWTAQERGWLEQITRPPQYQPQVFIHGDVWRANLLAVRGVYRGLIDWGSAGWSCLEHECAMMEVPALQKALKRWHQRLDLKRLWHIRSAVFLKMAQFGQLPFAQVRAALGQMVA